MSKTDQLELSDVTPVSFRDQVADYFRAYPNEWIDGLKLGTIGGAYAWRSRISNCRKDLGMAIENRQRRTLSGIVVSEYRYTPARDVSLGPRVRVEILTNGAGVESTPALDKKEPTT